MERTSTRKLSQTLLASLVALAALALGVTHVAAKGVTEACDCTFQSYRYTFDKSTDPWEGASFGGPFDRVGSAQPIVLSLGGDGKNHYAQLTNENADAVWMQASFKATANNLYFYYDVMNADKGDRLAPIVYVGQYAPTSLYQFQKIGYPLGKGKQTLYRQVDLAAEGLVGKHFVIAIGYMNLDGIQKAQAGAVDNINVFIHDGD